MRLLLLTLCLFFSNSISALSEQNPPSKTQTPNLPDDYVIGLEDILSINVWEEPKLTVKEVVVRPDGKISIPLIGDIGASQLTPTQLQNRITERLKEFVSAPTVTVVIIKIGSRSVSVVGEVAKPGIYYLGSPMTVLELLARAGGIRPDANSKKISIVRNEGDKTISYRFNYKEVSKGINLRQNIELKSGDVIIVP